MKDFSSSHAVAYTKCGSNSDMVQGGVVVTTPMGRDIWSID